MIITAHDRRASGVEESEPATERPSRFPGSYGAAREAGVNPRRVWARLAAGWGWDKALSTPAMQRPLSEEDAAWRRGLLESVLTKHGLSQTSLARMMSVAPSMISKWRHAKQPIPDSRLSVLANLLDAPI